MKQFIKSIAVLASIGTAWAAQEPVWNANKFRLATQNLPLVSLQWSLWVRITWPEKVCCCHPIGLCDR